MFLLSCSLTKHIISDPQARIIWQTGRHCRAAFKLRTTVCCHGYGHGREDDRLMKTLEKKEQPQKRGCPLLSHALANCMKTDIKICCKNPLSTR